MDTPDSSPHGEASFSSSALDKISDLATDSISYIEKSTRRSPLQAIACAVTAGYLLRQIPVFSLIGALLRVILVLIRPAALIFGGIKLCQFLSGTTPFKRSEDYPKL
jgi:hypothetical protein